MGDIAEYFAEQEFDRYLEHEEASISLLVDEIWCCANGAYVKATDMETSHIINARNMLLRNGYLPYLENAWVEVFNRELKRRGIES